MQNLGIAAWFRVTPIVDGDVLDTVIHVVELP